MNLALFDFDHTITHTDSFAQFLKYSLSYRKLFFGGFRAAPWFMAFRAGYVSDQQIGMRLCRVAYKNYPVNKLEQQGLQFSKTILPNLLHEHAKQRIA